MNFCFGDIVVVEKTKIGVVVKSWINSDNIICHDIYVRLYNCIKQYKESEIQRYMVRHKYLNEEELCYQSNAIKGQ